MAFRRSGVQAPSAPPARHPTGPNLKGKSRQFYRRRLRMLSVALLVTPPEFAVIVTEVFALTGVVTMAKLAELAPAATVTFGGTLAIDGLLLARVTSCPFAAAGPFKVTIPVEEAPPLTVDGESVNVDKLGGFTEIRVDLVTLKYDAEMVALVTEATGNVLIWKVAEAAPGLAVTLGGTAAAALSLVRVMVAPPDGAGAVRFTVAAEVCPPITEDGF